MKTKYIKSRKILLLGLGFIILLLLGIPQNLFKKNIQNYISNDAAKRNNLEETYKVLMDLDKKNDVAGFYEYLTPSEKTSISKVEFVQQKKPAKFPISLSFVVHSIEVSGDRGVIDRTRIACYTTECTGKDRVENRVKKEYFYINGKWYQPLDNNVLCDRTEEYVYPEEFKRAVSLIIQRREQSSQNESVGIGKNYKKIRNCLDIQYISDTKDLAGAEGFFSFDRNSTTDRLKIFISTKYQVKDDLLTALLLAHEIQHAYQYASGSNTLLNCYELEAEAFANEIGIFDFDFNKEEQNSLINRYGTSPEVKDFFDLRAAEIRNVHDPKSETIYQAILPIVKNSPFYQKECANN